MGNNFNKKIKFVSFTLIVFLCIDFISSPMNVRAENEIVYSKIKENGVEYTISTYSISDSRCVIVRKSNSKNYYKLCYNKERKELITEEYKSKGKNFIGVNQYSLSYEKMYLDDLDTSNGEICALGTTWNSKTYEKWKKDYWYQKGNDGSKIYYKIGCKASYRIRVDNSSKNMKACKNYANAIKSCNNHYLTAMSLVAGTDVSLAVIYGLIVANIAFPATVIVDIVVAAVGAGSIGTTVKEMVDSYTAYKDVKDYYIDARACGKKL